MKHEIKLEKRTEGERKAYLEGYEAGRRNGYDCIRVKVRDRKGRESYVLYDKARQLLFFNYMAVEFAKEIYGIEFIEESEE